MTGRWIFFLLTLLAARSALAQEDPDAALQAAIAARAPAAVVEALAAGARPDRPAQAPAAFALVEALAATPDEATRATVLAFAEAAREAGFGPETQMAGATGGSGGSLASRLAALPGEEALFLRVAALAAPERRCALLGQLIFGRDGANFAAAAALLPLIPAERAAEPACSLPFTMLAHPARRPPPALVEAMLEAGLRPYPDTLAELLRLVPPGAEGDGAFRQLAALNLGVIATDTHDGVRRRLPVLAQLGEDILVDRAPRAEMLSGRWGALLEATPEMALCTALPGPAIRGWLAFPDEDLAPEAAALLRRTTEALVRRCPTGSLAAVLDEAAGQRLWARLVALRETPLVMSMVAAGLHPADAAGLLGTLACAAMPEPVAALLAVAGRDAAAGALGRFVGCLGGVEATRDGDRATLAAILEMASGNEPVAGDAPIAIAAGIDRADIVEALADHGAAAARLTEARQAFWRHRRLAALARFQGPPLPWEEALGRVPAAPELVSLASGLGAWVIQGDCGPSNCGYAIAVREGRGYRLVLEAAGERLRLEPAIRREAREVTVRARVDAATELVTTWRYDGRLYRQLRCAEVATEAGAAAVTRPRACPG